MRRFAALAFLLVACSTQTPTSASASPASCRLPVVAGAHGQGSGPQTPGFLSIPGLTFSEAAGAGDGMYYDKPLARWVPWGPPALSHDGATYAYVDGDQTSSRVHLVDVTTKSDSVLAEGGPWRLVGLAPDAVYLMRVEYFDSAAFGVMAAGRGLWRLKLKGSALDQLTSDNRGWTLGAGAAWGGGSTVDVAGGPNDIVRLDLITRQSTTWFARGTRSFVLAIDAGGVPLVMSEAADQTLWRVPAPGGDVKVWSGPTDGPRPYAPVAVGSGAVWFSSANTTRTWSIFRYTATTGLERVADFSDHPVTIAGPCA